ncbi:MAG: type II toxin-antitoxin system RelE/ParE family toxin [Candidatus Omnitrophota bacterium]
MIRRIAKRNQVIIDLEEICDYIGNDNISAAIRFLEAAEYAFEELAKMPLIGQSWKFSHPDLVNIRFLPIPGFERYLIFYQVLDECIDIVRIIHSARDIPTLLEEDNPF